MCGIAGFLTTPGGPDAGPALAAAVECMAGRLRHRGPDDSGSWVDGACGVALGHRRLAILDLSPEGHQPMVSATGRYVLVFNGEIYNFAAVRRELDRCGAPVWRGRSDTEVMLAAFEEWGVTASLGRFAGMFAFALWDRRDRCLYLGRDRFGEKPLYYGWSGNTLLFGSELKALRAHPGFRATVDRDALTLYLRHNCIPAPRSVYAGIAKLPPGTVLKVPWGCAPGYEPAPEPYWQVRDVAESGAARPLQLPDAEAAGELDTLLRGVVADQMVADVPLGAFLSGGVDSSLVVALMQSQSTRPVQTFTIGFHEVLYNEADHARAVAAHLGTEHTELYVTPDDALAVIPRLPELFDEPFADSSQIPTWLVAQLTRRSVTVSLSGDGGDELFAGYNRHYWLGDIWRRVRHLPAGGRRLLSSALRSVSPDRWNDVYGPLAMVLPKRCRVPVPGHSIHKLADILGAAGPEEMYLRLVSHWRHPEQVVVGGTEPPTLVTDRERAPRLDEFTQRMLYLDQVTYLPDDILAKVDRAGMGVSLETRMPYLDHRVAEFAWRLPLHQKVRDGRGKWLLRQVLDRYVPRSLVERPKAGFGVPIDAWLRGPLRPWAEELLDEGRLRREGYLHPGPIRALWHEHLSGRHNRQYHLWDILMFQAWLEAQA